MSLQIDGKEFSRVVTGSPRGQEWSGREAIALIPHLKKAMTVKYSFFWGPKETGVASLQGFTRAWETMVEFIGKNPLENFQPPEMSEPRKYTELLAHFMPRGDYAAALRYLQPIAQKGAATHQFLLALLYDKAQDHTQAVLWYRRAAEQGYADAQYHLGIMYDNGKGVAQDYGQAVFWWRNAAEQGYADAQNNLGVAYAYGRGVPQDDAQAFFWYSLAAVRYPVSERDKAVKNRDAIATRLTPAQLASAQAHAQAWQPKPATSVTTAPLASSPRP